MVKYHIASQENMTMRHINYSPLYRSSIGFDRLAALLDSTAAPTSISSGYPPYDIEHQGVDEYEITMAVAGFKEDDLHIEVENNYLVIKGSKVEEKARKYLHKGIAARNFERRFELADHIKVTDARLSDGQLSIHLSREVPEEMKPRSITINSSASENLIQDDTEKAA
jgi:molecular chaperone IbpA